jgi:hypothetical protein
MPIKGLVFESDVTPAGEGALGAEPAASTTEARVDGTEFGDFFVEEALEGNGANRARARQRSTGKAAVIHIFPGASGAIVLRIAHDRGTLSSDDLVDVLGAGVTPTPWIATEQPAGVTLDEFVSKHGHALPSEVAIIATHLTRGLATVHRAGLVHGGFGPDVVWLEVSEAGRMPRCRIASLGFALAATNRSPLAPPETKHSARGDVYSLGMTIFFALAGSLPAPGSNAGELMSTAQASRFALPPGLATWISRCISREAEYRFADAGDAASPLAHALGELATTPRAVEVRRSEDQPIEYGHPYRASENVEGRRRDGSPDGRRTWVWLLAGACGFVVLGAAGVATTKAVARAGAQLPHTPAIAPQRLQPAVDIAAHYQAVFGVAPLLDGKSFATTSWDDSVRFWSLEDGSSVRTLSPTFGHGGALAVDPKTGDVAAGGQTSIKIWSPSGELERTISNSHGQGVQVTSLAFTEDGAVLASAGLDGTVRLWDGRTGAAIRTIKDQSGRVISVSVSPDGQVLATGGDDGKLRVWAVADGALVRAIPAHRGPIDAVRFGPDGQTIVTASDDGSVGVFHRDTGVRLWSFPLNTGELWSLSLDPSGRLLAVSGQSGHIFLISLFTRTMLRTWLGHEHGTLTLAFSRDGAALLSGGGDQRVRVWRNFR